MLHLFCIIPFVSFLLILKLFFYYLLLSFFLLVFSLHFQISLVSSSLLLFAFIFQLFFVFFFAISFAYLHLFSFICWLRLELSQTMLFFSIYSLLLFVLVLFCGEMLSSFSMLHSQLSFSLYCRLLVLIFKQHLTCHPSNKQLNQR